MACKELCFYSLCSVGGASSEAYLNDASHDALQPIGGVQEDQEPQEAVDVLYQHLEEGNNRSAGTSTPSLMPLAMRK